MKVRLISDLHFEFFVDKDLFSNKGEDVLVIAGDLNVGSQNTFRALKQFYEHQKHIIYVPGNHEYYGGRITEIDEELKRFCEGTNIHFLNPGTVKIDGVTFIGATLWSSFRNDHWARIAAKDGINDFRLIKGFSTDQCANLCEEHIQYIHQTYAVTEGEKVIVTHFLPAVECIAPRFQKAGLINNYFANDFGPWIGFLQNTTWLFGHTHDNVNITLGNTRLVANPYGYYKNPHYKDLIIEV